MQTDVDNHALIKRAGNEGWEEHPDHTESEQYDYDNGKCAFHDQRITNFTSFL